jgi:hypothetical protein
LIRHIFSVAFYPQAPLRSPVALTQNVKVVMNSRTQYRLKRYSHTFLGGSADACKNESDGEFDAYRSDVSSSDLNVGGGRVRLGR